MVARGGGRPAAAPDRHRIGRRTALNTAIAARRIPALPAWCLAALALLGQGCTGEEIHRHGGSTAIIRQSGPGHSGAVQVWCHHDGQHIVSRREGSTDVTIQTRADGSTPCLHWREGQRFPADAALSGPASDAAFRERMRARMQQRLPP